MSHPEFFKISEIFEFLLLLVPNTHTHMILFMCVRKLLYSEYLHLLHPYQPSQSNIKQNSYWLKNSHSMDMINSRKQPNTYI